MANRFDPERSHRLDAPERAEWQKPREVVDALSLSDGDCVVEVGSGTGYFTRLISRSVGDQGKVVAVDPQERMLDALRARCDAEGLTNVQLVAGESRHPTGRPDRGAGLGTKGNGRRSPARPPAERD